MSDVEAALREPWVRYDEQCRAAQFGMWIFIASEVLFFGAFFCGFTYLHAMHGVAFATGSQHTGLPYGLANTLILLTSSLTMSLASRAARGGLRRLALIFLGVTLLLGCAFLVVKGFEYKDDFDKGLWPGPNFALPLAATRLFFAGYWMITIIHVVHLTSGIGLVGRLAFAIKRGRLALSSPQFEVAALYWTLVDIVWVLLFPIIYLGGRS